MLSSILAGWAAAFSREHPDPLVDTPAGQVDAAGALAEVERLTADLVAMARHNPPGSDAQPQEAEDRARRALLGYVRTLITSREPTPASGEG